MTLIELLDKDDDEKSFGIFVSALISDLHKSPNEWQNITVETFLESALAWAESSNFGNTQGLKDVTPWKKFASFLYKFSGVIPFLKGIDEGICSKKFFCSGTRLNQRRFCIAM